MFNTIVFKKNGIAWEALSGTNTSTGYKYLANIATNNGYSLTGSAIIYSSELFIKQMFTFADGAKSILLNIGQSKFYWSYDVSNYGSRSILGLQVSSAGAFTLPSYAGPTRNLNQMSWYSSGSNNVPQFEDLGYGDCNDGYWINPNPAYIYSYRFFSGIRFSLFNEGSCS